MAKIVSFTKSLNRTGGHALDSFVDDGDLLEFPRPEDAQTQSAHPKSIFASDWSNQELADLYRAYSLIQSAQPGLECDRGISDEGDPWFLIGDAKGDVLVHICRIQGTYILDSVALSKALRGADFNALVQDFLTTVVGEQAQDAEATQEPANVVRLARGGTVCLHPSMMIAALVWTLLMNADELTLPPANDASQKGLNQGQDIDQGGDQDTVLPGDLPSDDIAYSGNLLDKPGTGTVDFSDELSTAAMISQIAQRDEKQLHVSAYSQALTTIAIAAGFYASAEAFSVFWKSTQAPTDTFVSLGETEARETSDLVSPLDHLSDALALLSSAVDPVVFESHKDYAAENRNAKDESTKALTSEASIGQQMLTMASEVINNIAEASQLQTADEPGNILKSEFDFEAANTVQAGMAARLPDNNLVLDKQTSDTSIRSIAEAYASSDVDVSRYDTSSFQTGVGEFNCELQQYSEVFESASFPTPGDSTGASGDDDQQSPSGAGDSGAGDTFPESSYLNAFDDAARNFIDSKIANADLEILVFKNEIIFVDKAAFSGNNTTVSWQLEDGGLVSMIGLSSDMAEFLVA